MSEGLILLMSSESTVFLLMKRNPVETTATKSVGEIFEMDSSDWSNGIRYHVLNFQTRN